METQLRESHNSRFVSSEKSAENSPLSVESRHALAAWVRAKQSLERVMRREDFQSFIRPMYLGAVLSRCCMLLTLPPNKRLFERARNFRPNLVAAIEQQNYHFAGIARYPTDDELVQLRNSPNYESSWKPFVELIWRKRQEKLAATRPAEDERDCADLSRELAREAGRMEVRA
jgi:hypothetical protein